MKQDKVFVSIIIPIFNMEKYLQRCLESLRNQTFRMFEVIMVDDGSEDKSKDICENFLADTRFIYIKQQNQGVSTARNIGLAAASGIWISFVDPDDYLEPNFLQILIGYCDYGNVDIISCCCKIADRCDNQVCHFFDGNQCFGSKEHINLSSFGDFAEIKKKEELLKQLMYVDYFNKDDEKHATAIGVPWGKLYRKAFLDQYRLTFDRDLIRMQDNIFNMYAFDKACCIFYVDKGLYCYSVSHIQALNSKFDSRIHEYFGKVIKLRYEYLTQKGLLNDDELYSLYLGEGGELLSAISSRYFFHPGWRASYAFKRVEMDKFYNDSIYREIIENYEKIPDNRVSRFAKIKLYLLKNRKYRLLMIVEKINRIRYFLKDKK